MGNFALEKVAFVDFSDYGSVSDGSWIFLVFFKNFEFDISMFQPSISSLWQKVPLNFVHWGDYFDILVDFRRHASSGDR